MKLKIER